jgi:hypothetical protein
MKIILTDNYAREHIAEVLLYEHLHPWIAEWMLTEMLRARRDDDPRWPIVRDDNYRLWRGMEDLI